MHDTKLSRRNFLANATMGSLAACALPEETVAALMRLRKNAQI